MGGQHFENWFFFILDDGKQILIDIDSRSKDEIEDHLRKVVGKSR